MRSVLERAGFHPVGIRFDRVNGDCTVFYRLPAPRGDARPVSEAKLPNELVNIDVTCKPSLREHPEIGPAIGAAEERLSGSGRILVRYSGTEPKVRIMVEAESSDLLEKIINQISPLLRKHLSISNDPAPKRRDDPPKEAR